MEFSISPATSLWHEQLIKDYPRMNTQDYQEEVMPITRTFDTNRPKTLKARVDRLKRLQAEKQAREQALMLPTDDGDLIA